MAVEYWDILDREGNFTGRRMKREHFNHFRSGQYHLVVHIWIKNSNGQFLIQKRSADRMPMPGEWAATGGSVQSGETSKTAAVRELNEELGIVVRENEIRHIKRFARKNSFIDMWYVGVDVTLNNLVLQADEVETAKWVTVDELRQMVKNKEFHNYGDDYFEVVFSL